MPAFFENLLTPARVCGLVAALAAGCQAGSPVVPVDGAAILVQPTILAAERQLQAVVTPYTLESVNHLAVKLFTVGADNVTETQVRTEDIVGSEVLGGQIRFTTLKYNTRYRVRAYAYASAGTGSPISVDAASQTDVTTLDTAPVLASVPVRLADQTFGASGTFTGTTITAGGLLAHSTATSYGTAPTPNYIQPLSVAFDSAGNAYVADNGNTRIVKITAAGIPSVFNVGPAYAVAVDANDNVYVADPVARGIRKVTPAGVSSTYAGSGTAGSADGAATVATFGTPRSLAFDGDGNLYVADETAHRIRRIAPEGIVSTLAGSDAGYVDGTGVNAKFNGPTGITVDRVTGHIFVAEYTNNKVRKITPAGVVSTYAAATTFSGPAGIVADATGQVYVSLFTGMAVRRIAPDESVVTVLGTGLGNLQGMGIDAGGVLYVADSSSAVIRKIQ